MLIARSITVHVAIIMLCLVSVKVFSQTKLHTKSKKAIEYYTTADDYRVRGHYDIAIRLLKKAIQKDDQFAEAYVRMGLVYRMANNLTLCRENYETALSIFQTTSPTYFLFELGEMYLQLGEYQLSKKFLSDYLVKVNPTSRKFGLATKMLSDVEFAIKTISEAEPIEIKPLSDTVNKFALQYFPVLTADQKQLIYTRRLGNGPHDFEDLMISRKNENGNWDIPVSLSRTINSDLNEGTCTISADGRILIFTSCEVLGEGYGKDRKGFGSCDLFISKKVGEVWSAPKNMGSPVNSTDWDSQPSLSADGRILYFVSTRKGGIGKQDIWVSYLDIENEWSEPINLGNTINTKENEISPYLHSNGQTLYFSSNGFIGMGGFDIYYSERSLGEFTQPTNFGYPVNNGQDQVSIFITSDGKHAYYSNECGSGSRSCSKLYTFDIPESKRISFKSNFISGRVLDSLTNNPVKANIELYDVDDNQLVLTVNSDSVSGEYLMVLTEGANYAMYVYSRDYLYKSEKFEYSEKEDVQPIYRDIYLSKVTKGAKVELKNIYFDHDSYEINEKSKVAIDMVVKFLNENPNVSIRIEGHTDEVGNEEYNLELSEKRAKSVFQYLLKNDIPQNGVEYRGFGSKYPRYSNKNKSNRSKNRRTEFVIL